jgi:RND superfamily putative drug exporter
VPALLGTFGGRIKLAKHGARDVGFFSRVTEWSQRRPLVVIAGVTVLLLAVAAPFLHIKLADNGVKLLPKSFETRVVAESQARFGTPDRESITVAAAVAPSDPRVAAYLAHLSARADVASATLDGGYDATVVSMRVVPKDGSADGAAALTRSLRADRPPSVTGGAAFLADFSHNLKTRLPLALGIMGLATLLLLFLMTGSLLVPIKAIVMNLLSLGASFGAIVWVFQDGHFASALGAEPMGGIEQWIPMLVLVFAFGLSMDYEVFLISRIKELYDEGLPNQRAVVLGVQRTGRIITSAALLIVIVFAGFGAGKMVGIKEMGIALTIAIIVDATVVRCFLVPATMSLLGELNWWAPGPLRRLHARYGLREAPAAAVDPTAEFDATPV